MQPAILYQDNESTIKQINNGRRSSSSKTRHIDNRYFCAHDKVQKGEIIVSYVPTERMWAEEFSKPPQGNPFFYSGITSSILILKCDGECVGTGFLAELHLRISIQDRSSSATRRR